MVKPLKTVSALAVTAFGLVIHAECAFADDETIDCVSCATSNEEGSARTSTRADDLATERVRMAHRTLILLQKLVENQKKEEKALEVLDVRVRRRVKQLKTDIAKLTIELGDMTAAEEKVARSRESLRADRQRLLDAAHILEAMMQPKPEPMVGWRIQAVVAALNDNPGESQLCDGESSEFKTCQPDVVWMMPNGLQPAERVKRVESGTGPGRSSPKVDADCASRSTLIGFNEAPTFTATCENSAFSVGRPTRMPVE